MTMRIFPCLILLVSAMCRAEGIVFPVAAKVVDITKAPYHATPNDDTDDTAAFQKALADDLHLIYIPNGTYVITDTLRWGAKEKRQVLQGQSEAGAVLKLKDSAQGFGDPSKPKAMIWTGKAPAQRFRNGLRDLTIDTGKGNPGAIGAQFVANNQGGIRNVTFRTGGPSEPAKIGLDLGYTDEQGPCLMRDVTVIGFDIGVSTSHAVNSVTFERLNLRNQRLVGFNNDGQCVSIRNLRSENAVPAYINVAGPSTTALIDSELKGTDPKVPAIVNGAYLFARNVKTEGYAQAIRNDTGTRQSVSRAVVEEFVSHPVLSAFPSPLKSLNLPIVETPSVPWDELAKWASVTDFGPPKQITLVRKSDGKKYNREDWSEPLQKAIDSGATTVYFPYRQSGYGMYGTVHLRGNLQRLIGLETDSSMLVNSNQEKTDYQDDARLVFVMADGTAPAVVVERFNTWYAATRFEQRSKRTLVISSMSTYDIHTEPGSGDVFLDDVRTKEIRVNRSRLFGRQVNPEGWEEPRILNDGGQIWILGLKTENAPTICVTRNQGKTEIVGGFFYANKGSEKPIRMFVVESGGAFSATGGSWKTRKGRAFDDILVETRDGQTRNVPRADSYPRGEANTFPLLVAYTGDAKEPPDAPAGVSVTPSGSGRLEVKWRDAPARADGVRISVHEDGKPVATVQAPPDATHAVVQRGLRAGTSYRVTVASYNAAGESVATGYEQTVQLPTATVQSDGTGLVGEYFNDPGFANQKASRTDPQVNFNWSVERPAQGMPAKNYSVRWRGVLVPRFSDEYTLVVEASGGVRLWLDNQPVIDAWPAASKKEVGRVELEAGKRHRLRIEYTNIGGGGSIAVHWFSANQKHELLPQSQLFPEAGKEMVVQVAAYPATIEEKGAPVVVSVERSGTDLSRPLTVPFERSGQAVADVDYRIEPPDAIYFEPGQARTQLVLTPLDNTAGEPDEGVAIELLPDAAFLTANGNIRMTIRDDDMPPAGNGTGLVGEYFADAELSKPVGTRTDKQVHFGWDKKKPHPDVDPETPYSVRWKGFLQPLFTEEYVLELTRSKYSGIRLYVDGQLVVDRWESRTRAKGQSAVDGDEPALAKLALQAGKKHEIVVEFVHRRAYGSNVALKWSSASQFEEVVPATQLYSSRE